MWIFLAGDAVGFGALLAAYGAMRATSVDWPNPYQVLGINLTALMTFLLICSSVTMVKALEWLGKGEPAAGQEVPPAHRARRRHLREPAGLRVDAPDPSGAARSTATPGAPRCSAPLLHHHRLPRPARDRRRHLPPGRLRRGQRGVRTCGYSYNMVEIVGLYWHFVDLVWIMVFTFIYLL